MIRCFTLYFVLLCCGINVAFAQSKFPRGVDGVEYFKMPTDITPDDYRHNIIILKVREEFRNASHGNGIDHPRVQAVLQEISVNYVRQKFPQSKRVDYKVATAGEQPVDISLIYELSYSGNTPLEKLINQLLATGTFMYAEPAYVFRTTFTPDDPEISEQWHLAKIKAFEAWDISQGSSDVVIAIVDTGTDLDHPDLQDKFATNAADPENGIDDDNDGFVDNFFGWNFFDDNGNPQSVGIDHGVHVSGCASPTTNNGTGIAGPGFNSSLLAVKAGSGFSIRFGYEGIVYAADHGADIINCSWGGGFSGQFGQDVVDYAALNKNALVIAGAGNGNTDRLFYPGSYRHVMNVAATDEDDSRASFSNFHYSVDISAPGMRIYSTKDEGNYGFDNGTSMAAPIVAGCAAIVKAVHPNLTGLQIGEQLKATADDIYSIAGNDTLLDKLGTGRVNLLNAVGNIASPAVVMTEQLITDNDDDAFIPNDVIEISGVFTNYLNATGNLVATISTTSTAVDILDGTKTLGVISTLATTDNYADPFVLQVNETAELNEEIVLEIALTDGTYSTKAFAQLMVNVDYLNIKINEVQTTVTSKGVVGYNVRPQLEGLGFSYGTYGSLFYEAGLMVGVATSARNKVVDLVRGEDNIAADRDLVPVENVVKIEPPLRADFDAQGKFDDSNARLEVIGLDITHKAFAWEKAGHRKYVIFEYDITNKTSETLQNLYAGIFADWDIINAAENKADYDSFRYLGYTFSTGATPVHAGIQLLTPYPFYVYSLDNTTSGNGGVSMSDSNNFSTDDKFVTLTTNRFTAGGGSGRDVAQVISTGGLLLPPGETVTVAFALMAGDDLADLQNTADSAYKQYNGKIPNANFDDEFILYQNYPNPAASFTKIEFDLKEEHMIRLSLQDKSGREVRTLKEGTTRRGRHAVLLQTDLLSAGNYFYTLEVEGKTQSKRMIIVR